MIPAGRQWFKNDGAPTGALAALCESVDLPAEYIELLASSNGGEGSLDVPPYSFVLYSAEQVTALRSNSKDNIPGFFIFGGNGKNQLIALDMRGGKPWPVVTIDRNSPHPAESATVIAEDFSLFITHIGVNPHEA